MKKFDYVIKFIKYTLEDFEYVWSERPNVLIWCGVLGVVLILI